MYRSIVARKVRATFEGLSAGDASALNDQLADDFTYVHVGDHALGGTRTCEADMTAWFERVYRLFTGIRFDPSDIVVSGLPWKTTVLAHVDITTEQSRTEMSQRITIAWGRITSIRTLVDLQKLNANLGRLAEAGVTEALAAPINS